LPADGFATALFLIGRRSGKSRIAAIVGAFEAILAGHERKLAKGEQGSVVIVAPSKNQGRIIRNYLRAIFETELLRHEVVAEERDGFTLKTGTRIQILAGDFRTVRGFTLLAAVIDEAAFFGTESEGSIKSDTELVRAIQPSLATVGGKLIAITSPYARRGWTFQTFKKHHGSDNAKTLVWNCASRTMNPTLSQEIVDQALQDDLQAAKSEYLGEFRDDIAAFLSRDVIEALVVPGRLELSPQSGIEYVGFCDISGGRHDDAALAIAHRREDDQKIVIDCLTRYRPPFNPNEVVGQMVQVVRRYGIARVTGDNYSAEFVKSAFESRGIEYERASNNPWSDNALAKIAKPKNQLYLELLPRLCSGQVELLDSEPLVNQLAALERRTRSGGRDVIDHPPNGRDDMANAVAGAVDCASQQQTITLGVMFGESHQESDFARRHREYDEERAALADDNPHSLRSALMSNADGRFNFFN
jgi:hypothetical protein